MTCDERIEGTLNKCGQTISDLPKDYSDTDCMRAYMAVQEWRSENGLTTWHECEKYVLHLTDIIDRLEWALENVCGARDYLLKRLDWHGALDCEDCIESLEEDEAYCERCKEELGSAIWIGVPEYRSVDDEKGL